MSFRRITLAATLVAGGLAPLAVSAAADAGAAPAARSLCAPASDTVGPVATKATFGRASIDLDSGSRKQTVTVDASDTSGNGPASGVAHVRLEVEGKDFFASPKLTRTSGTSSSGEWTGTFTVSKYAHPGTYSVVDLSVTDVAGNQQDYPGYERSPEGPNALSLNPAIDPTFAVTGTPATRPKGRPGGTLSSFSLSPSHVNTTSSAHRVHFHARFTGAAPSIVTVEVGSANFKKQGRFVFLSTRLHDRHGHWAGSVSVPRWLGKTKLQASLSARFAKAYRPSARYYGADKLQHLHFASTISVVSGVDKSKPKLTSLSLSPDPIDSTTGPETVTVTATATDTGSGVQSISVSGGIRHGVNGVPAGAYPYASAGVGFLSSQDFTARLRKTANGDWVGTTTIKQCVPSGTYKLSADLRDHADNYAYDSSKTLAKAHLASTVDVTSKHGDITAPYVYSAATYGADHELFLNFSEGVKQVSTSTLTVFPLTPASTRFTTPSTIASIVCSNGTSTVDCSGSGGAVTSAVLTIPGLSAGQKYEVWGNLNQVVPQLTDPNGNPLDWNYSAAEVIDS